MYPFLDSSDVIDNGAELAARMERDGYLFVRGLMPADVLENLRLQILEIAQEAGWVNNDAPLADGIADLDGFCVEPDPIYMQIYHQMYIRPDFQAFQHHPSLLGLFERMLGEEVLPHPRLIGRTIFPQKDAFTTPPHQDFIPIQGTADTYTAWVPLSDVPVEVGGLQVAAGSHKQGVYDFQPALGAGGLAVINPLEGTWVSSPFEQGDVLIFYSMAVHKGLPNHSPKLRMSMDARYQRASEPIAPGSLEPHSKPHTWEEIYADWPHDDLKYYWKKWDLDVKAYDNSYHDKRDEMAWEMAEAGDVRALSTLQRIIARDLDPAKRKQAEAMLAELEAKVGQV